MMFRSNQQRQLHSDLLRAIIKLCMKRHVQETGRWQLGFLRGVCRDFRDWCDELAPVLLHELDYELRICNTSMYHEARTKPHPWAEMLLAAAPRLAIDVPVFTPGVPNDEDEGEEEDEEELAVLALKPAALLTRGFLEAAACMRELWLQQLPPQLASTNPEVLLALPCLERLAIELLSGYECDEEGAWEWLAHWLAQLQSLQELAVWVEEVEMRDALDLQAFGPSLPASLTSLSLGLKPQEGIQDDLAHLSPADLSEAVGHLRKLQGLQLCGMLAGPQQVPPALAGLTRLELQNNFELQFGPCLLQLTGLCHLDLSHCGLQAWPEGLPALTALTSLQIQGDNLGGLSEEEPPSLAALTRLQHLSLIGFPPPDLAPLADLRCLELEVTPSQLPALLLGRLTRLTNLMLDNSTPAELDLSACTGLRRLELGWIAPSGTSIAGSAWTPVAGLAGLVQLTALLLRRCLLEPGLQLRGLTQLQELELQNCRLRRLPQGITTLTGLRSLNLMRNRIVPTNEERAWLCWTFPGPWSDWDVNREARSAQIEDQIEEGNVMRVRCISLPPWAPLTDDEGGY